MKKLLALLLAFLMTLSLAACGGKDDTKDEKKSSKKSDSKTESIVQEQDDENEEMIANDEEPDTYETDWLTYVGGAKDFGDNFGYFMDEYNVVMGKDGKIYNTLYPKSDWFDEESDVQEIVIAGEKYGYKDSKGFIHLYDYLLSDIKGDIFYGFKNSFGSNFIVFSRDTDGKMYVNSFDKAGNKDSKYNNAPLYMRDMTDDVYHNTIDKIEVVKYDNAGNTKFYIEKAGKRYYYNFTSVMKYEDGYQFWMRQIEGDPAVIYDYGYYKYSPIYSKSNDQTTIYYRDGDTELPIFLPEGYTTTNIKNVYFDEITVIIFDDGALYTAELTHNIAGPTLVKEERISKLGKDGKVLDAYWVAPNSSYGDGELRVVMDDNCIYSVVAENTGSEE